MTPRLRKTVSATRKRYTVAFNNVDPTYPVELYNTNDRDKAIRVFESWREIERSAAIETWCAGGEWYVALWDHKVAKDEGRHEVTYFAADTEFGHGVYAIDYPWSDKIRSYTYMDAARMVWALINEEEL